MNKKTPLLLLALFSLASCAKTAKLYDANAYNHVDFDKNYYTEWEGIDKLEFENTSKKVVTDALSVYDEDYNSFPGGQDYTWGGDKEKQFGYNNNLSKVEKKFSYGITSKLFDGRVRCERLYQKSRMQIDASGFAMYFPKQLVSATYLSFACRGGTNYYVDKKSFNNDNLLMDFEWSFYIHKDNGKYDKVVYNLKNVGIPCDNDGNTSYVSLFPSILDFRDIENAVGMSLTWKCVDPKYSAKTDLSENKNEKNKYHLALMLYEVFIGNSLWK